MGDFTKVILLSDDDLNSGDEDGERVRKKIPKKQISEFSYPQSGASELWRNLILLISFSVLIGIVCFIGFVEMTGRNYYFSSTGQNCTSDDCNEQSTASSTFTEMNIVVGQNCTDEDCLKTASSTFTELSIVIGQNCTSDDCSTTEGSTSTELSTTVTPDCISENCDTATDTGNNSFTELNTSIDPGCTSENCNTSENRTFTAPETTADRVCISKDCYNTARTILAALDTSVDPCQNFSQFACGGWISETLNNKDSIYLQLWNRYAEMNEVIMQRIQGK